MKFKDPSSERPNTAPYEIQEILPKINTLRRLNEKLSQQFSNAICDLYLQKLKECMDWIVEHVTEDNITIKELRTYLLDQVRLFNQQWPAGSYTKTPNAKTVKFIHESDALASLLSWIGDDQKARMILFNAYMVVPSDESIKKTLINPGYASAEAHIQYLEILEASLRHMLENDSPDDVRLDNLWSEVFIAHRRMLLSRDVSFLLKSTEGDYPDSSDSFYEHFELFAHRKAEIEELCEEVEDEYPELRELRTEYTNLYLDILVDHPDESKALTLMAKRIAEGN